MHKDPYFLEFHEDINGFTFRDRNTIFLFPLKKLYKDLILLRATLLDENVCSFDLYGWPSLIFTKSPLISNPKSSLWIYKLVQTWALEIDINIHNRCKTEHFRIFLDECHTLVKMSERPEVQTLKVWKESDKQYEVLFELEFIILLITYALQLSNENNAIINFINGIALLPEFYKSKNSKIKKEFKILADPVITLLAKSIYRGEKFESVLNSEFIDPNGFYYFGVFYPMPRVSFLEHIQNLTNSSFDKHKRNKIFKDWVDFKYEITNKQDIKSTLGNTPPNQKRKTPRQIALIYALEGKMITPENRNEIASDNGYKSKTSGSNIYNLNLKYITSSKRLEMGEYLSKKNIKNVIDLYESIIIHLTDRAQDKAKEELRILKERLYDISC